MWWKLVLGGVLLWFLFSTVRVVTCDQWTTLCPNAQALEDYGIDRIICSHKAMEQCLSATKEFLDGKTPFMESMTTLYQGSISMFTNC